MQPIMLLTLSVAMLAVSGDLLADTEWGTLRGSLVLKGEPPELPQLDPGKDPVCCEANPQNQSLVLGESHGIANVVVYLRPPRGEQLPVHPDYAKSLREPVEFDNKGCAFTPHVTLVRVGQTLLLKNTDPVGHSVKGELGDEAFNFMLAGGGEQSLEFTEAQRLPRPVACSIHPFMRGWLLVRDDPYMAKTDKTGAFVIENLPAGEHEIQFWHERPGYLKGAASETVELSRRGRATLTIEADGTTDLGTLNVDAALMAVGDE